MKKIKNRFLNEKDSRTTGVNKSSKRETPPNSQGQGCNRENKTTQGKPKRLDSLGGKRMTSNQIEFSKQQETKRHNREDEKIGHEKNAVTAMGIGTHALTSLIPGSGKKGRNDAS